VSGDRTFERKHVLFVVLVALAVIAIPGRIAWSMRSDAAADATATRDQVRDLQDRIAQAQRDQRNSVQLNEQLKALAAALPPDADLASVVEQLAALAKEANVTWKTSAQNQPIVQRDAAASAGEDDGVTATTAARRSTSDAEAASEGGDQTNTTAVTAATSSSYLVDIDLEGTPANLTTFLEKLRSLPRLFTVERMTWAWRDGAAGGSNTQVVSAHVTLKAYSWSSAPKALPAGTGAATTTTATTVAGAAAAP
jgi:Tfp pilus assembly protein PilO